MPATGAALAAAATVPAVAILTSGALCPKSAHSMNIETSLSWASLGLEHVRLQRTERSHWRASAAPAEEPATPWQGCSHLKLCVKVPLTKDSLPRNVHVCQP